MLRKNPNTPQDAMPTSATKDFEARLLTTLAGLGSAALLVGAFAFEHIGGLYPCPLCIWQRWPHAVAIVMSVLAWFFGPRIFAWLGMLAALTSAAIAAFHTGVERGWWEGLEGCTGIALSEVDMSALLDPTIIIAEPARCDAVAWSMAGLSMASWNGIASLILAALWYGAARRG